VVILIFILTGQYMDKSLQHLVGMPDGPRMLYRTRHIYILLSGLLNPGIGTYFTYGWTRWRRVLQFLGSALIVAATALFIAGFFWEANSRAWKHTGLVRVSTSWHTALYCTLSVV
jgi:hypothetical protein